MQFTRLLRLVDSLRTVIKLINRVEQVEIQNRRRTVTNLDYKSDKLWVMTRVGKHRSQLDPLIVNVSLLTVFQVSLLSRIIKNFSQGNFSDTKKNVPKVQYDMGTRNKYLLREYIYKSCNKWIVLHEYIMIH